MEETYSLTSWIIIQNQEFHPGDPVTFDGTTVTIKHAPFIGFRSKKGELFVYADDACSRTVKLDTTLDPVVLVGATVRRVEGMEPGSTQVKIYTDRGVLTMFHPQECCERVELVDVTGDPEDLVGGVIGVFEVRSGTLDKNNEGRSRKKPTAEDRFAWRSYTFYELRTSKEDVTLRWGEPDNHDNNRYGEGISLSLESSS